MEAGKIKRFTVDEYYHLTGDLRAELIDGMLYNMAPPNRRHQKLLGALHHRIFDYIEKKGGRCEVYPAPFGVQLTEDEDTVVEPDISVICDPDKLTDRGCVGAPDWIIEIVSPGNPGHDYITKLRKYLAAGVREYWIVDPISEIVTVYDLTEGKTNPDCYTMKDTVKAGIYEDFSIDFGKLSEAE